MRSSLSCKCSIFLLLVVMATTLLACGGAFAVDAFGSITVNPSTAAVGTAVNVSFIAAQTQSQHPIVRINDHDATYINGYMNKYFNYSYTVRSDDPGGLASIYISGVGGSVTNTSALTITDLTPPTCTCTASPSYVTAAGTQVTLTVVADEPLQYPATVGIYDYRDDSYEYANWTGTNGNTYYYTYTVKQDPPQGNTPITIYACDMAGNWGTSDTYPVYVQTDTTPPSFECQGPTYAEAGDLVYLSVVPSEPLAYQPTVAIYNWVTSTYNYANYDNSQYDDYSGITYYYYTYTIQPSDPEGNTPVSVWGYDTSNNYGATEWLLPYFVDNGAPVVSDVLIPGAFTTSTSQLSATWSASDAMSGVFASYYAVGTTPGASDTKPWTQADNPGNQVVNDLSLTNGQTYFFSVKAVDYAGNECQPATADGIRVDTTPPDPFTPVASPSGWTNAASIQITFSTTDSVSGVSHYEVSVDGGAYTTQSSPYSLSTDGLSDGTHAVSVRAVDGAGLEQTGTVQVSIDRTPPTSPSPVTTPSAQLSRNSITASWVASADAASGIAKYQYRITGTGLDTNWQDVQPATATTYTATGLTLTPESLYTFKVRAVNGAGLTTESTAGNTTKIAARIYVDQGVAVGGNGASWQTAFHNIQDAIDATGEINEIWVKRTTSTSSYSFASNQLMYSSTECLMLKSGVKLYGGFLGTETDLSQRSTRYTTTLDAASQARVLTIPDNASAETVIDGFTMQNGQSTGAGGAIYCGASSQPIICNNYMMDCTATDGAAIFCAASSRPSISGNGFDECFADDSIGGAGAGGGIHCATGSQPIISGNDIMGCDAELGAGIYCATGSMPTITDNEIPHCYAARGGGIYCDKDSLPTISGNRIVDSGADYGGGLYCNEVSNILIENNTFGDAVLDSNGQVVESHGNHGGYKGIGVYCYKSTGTIRGNIIMDNGYQNPYIQGAGIYLNISNMTIDNNQIVGNWAGAYGGGIYCYWCNDGGLNIINNTIKDNRCGDVGASGGQLDTNGAGGGIFMAYCIATVTGNRIWNNGTMAFHDSWPLVNGGGMYVDSCDGLIQNNDIGGVTNDTAKGNKAQHGGGIYITGNGRSLRLRVYNNDIKNNQAVGDYYSGGYTGENLTQCGGGIYVDQTGNKEVLIDYNRIAFNVADSLTATDSLFGTGNGFGKGGGVLVGWSTSNVKLDHNDVYSNQSLKYTNWVKSKQGEGAGVYWNGFGTGFITNNTIRDNEQGGLWVRSGAGVTISGNTFSNNSGYNQQGP